MKNINYLQNSLAGKGVKEISRETGIPIRKVLHQIYCGEKEIKAHLKQL